MCIDNKQMHDKHNDQPSLSPSKATKTPKGQTKDTDKELDKTKHEAPCSANYRATQNKNNTGTIAPERSAAHTTGGGGGARGAKAFHCTNFTLGPDIILNTKTNKKTKQNKKKKQKKKQKKKKKKT